MRQGLAFFDHMLTAFARHGRIGLKVRANGDLHIDSHHTVEDVGIVLGMCIKEALGDKKSKLIDMARPTFQWMKHWALFH
ncbi:hypothetical protein GCM10020331_069080 [Ectobacillus funiculus]